MKKMFKQKIALIIFGLFLSAVLLEAGLRAGGFVYLSLQEYRNRISLKKKGTYCILCLGDSITAEQWPRPLEEILNKQDIGIKFSMIDKGRQGNESSIIVAKLEGALEEYEPDMVITMMGINDITVEISSTDIDFKSNTEFVKSFRT